VCLSLPHAAEAGFAGVGSPPLASGLRGKSSWLVA
jgi:hypothetical protein